MLLPAQCLCGKAILPVVRTHTDRAVWVRYRCERCGATPMIGLTHKSAQAAHRRACDAARPFGSPQAWIDHLNGSP